MSIKAHHAGLASGALAIVSVLGVTPAAHAFDFKISGQVNRAVIGANNGKSSDLGSVDNSSSPTRFKFSGSQQVSPNYKVGFDYEIGLWAGKGSHYDINEPHTDGRSGSYYNGTGTDNRQANVYIQGSFGKLTLGKQDGAANSTSKVDLSGLTDLGGGSVVDDYFGGISLLGRNGQRAAYINQVYSNFDALSRQNAIRYDTPSFQGATLSVSYDNGQAFEIAPRYEHTFGNGVKFAAALDYVDSGQQNQHVLANGNYDSSVSDPRAKFKEYGGSASILFPNGLNFFAQYKRRNYDKATYNDTHSIDYAQSYSGGIGYIVGKNHFQGFFGQTDNLFSENSQARNYGVAYRYDLKKSVNFYASYHHITASNLNDTGSDNSYQFSNLSPKNADVIFAGVRVKFF